MAYFAVTREKGAGWDRSVRMREQAEWDGHAEFMEGLVEEGFVVLAGPLGEGEKFLLIIEADSAEAVHAGLAPDPWTDLDLLRVAEVAPWRVLLGEKNA